jgi:hypothetical protein
MDALLFWVYLFNDLFNLLIYFVIFILTILLLPIGSCYILNEGLLLAYSNHGFIY